MKWSPRDQIPPPTWATAALRAIVEFSTVTSASPEIAPPRSSARLPFSGRVDDRDVAVEGEDRAARAVGRVAVDRGVDHGHVAVLVGVDRAAVAVGRVAVDVERTTRMSPVEPSAPPEPSTRLR